MHSLEIDYAAVGHTVSRINSIAGDDAVASAYEQLIAGITELKGEQAEAVKDLLKKEKAFAKQLDKTLKQFGKSLAAAAMEFETMDVTGSKIMGSGFLRS